MWGNPLMRDECSIGLCWSGKGLQILEYYSFPPKLNSVLHHWSYLLLHFKRASNILACKKDKTARRADESRCSGDEPGKICVMYRGMFSILPVLWTTFAGFLCCLTYFHLVFYALQCVLESKHWEWVDDTSFFEIRQCLGVCSVLQLDSDPFRGIIN